MTDIDEITNIVKKRVSEKEKVQKYNNLRKLVDEIKDFNNLTNEQADQNVDTTSTKSPDIKQLLMDLNKLYDIQTIRTIESSKLELNLSIKFLCSENVLLCWSINFWCSEEVVLSLSISS